MTSCKKCKYYYKSDIDGSDNCFVFVPAHLYEDISKDCCAYTEENEESDKMTEQEYLSQTINIWNTTGYDNTLDIENNKFIDNLFTESFIGQQDTGYYNVILDENGFMKLYKFLKMLLAYNSLSDEYLDDREGVWDLYSLMVDAIKGGEINGIKLEYVLTDEEE